MVHERGMHRRPNHGFHCVFAVGDQFFAVVEDERTEIITIVRITRAVFDFLRSIGVRVCTIVG